MNCVLKELKKGNIVLFTNITYILIAKVVVSLFVFHSNIIIIIILNVSNYGKYYKNTPITCLVYKFKINDYFNDLYEVQKSLCSTRERDNDREVVAIDSLTEIDQQT